MYTISIHTFKKVTWLQLDICGFNVCGFVCRWLCGCASFTYFGQLLRCPHKRIVNIMKVYIKRNNIQMELIRFRKISVLYPRYTGGAVPLRFLVKTAITAVTPPVVFFIVFHYPSHLFTAVEPPRDRHRVASQLFRDCTAVLYPVTPEARWHYGFWSKTPSP